MKHKNYISCPLCNSTSFIIKYEVKYEYSYLIDSDAPGLKNALEFLPFMFDNREQKESNQYIECNICKAKYPCYFNEWEKNISINDLQRAIDSANTEKEKSCKY